MPDTGTLTKHRIPAGNGVRVDAGVEEGQEVTINYDPMISKLCTYGADREQAVNRMLRALDEYEISGMRTTIPFCEFVLRHEAFVSGNYTTHFVPDHFEPEKLDEMENVDKEIQALAAALLKTKDGKKEEVQQNGELKKQTTKSEWWENRR